jgi:hypothetical protein
LFHITNLRRKAKIRHNRASASVSLVDPHDKEKRFEIVRASKYVFENSKED